MDFWLTRVKVNYELAGLPPPAILINFLWTYAAGGGKTFKNNKSIDSKPMKEYEAILDTYRNIGWDIAVINVGGVVDAVKLANDIKLVFDDMHHPSCRGSQLIADMLHHIFLTNLAQECPKDQYEKQWKIDEQTQTILPPITDVLAEIDEKFAPLWNDLFRDDTLIGAMTSWEPRVMDATNLHIQNFPNLTHKWERDQWGKAVSSREDRKYVYRMPKCEKGWLNITLLEPDLTWLGMHITGDGNAAVILLNDQPFQPVKNKNWNPAIVYVEYWANLKEHGVPKAKEYRLSYCNKNPDKRNKAQLGHLVGVSVAPTPKTKRVPPPRPSATKPSAYAPRSSS